MAAIPLSDYVAHKEGDPKKTGGGREEGGTTQHNAERNIMQLPTDRLKGVPPHGDAWPEEAQEVQGVRKEVHCEREGAEGAEDPEEPEEGWLSSLSC